MSSVLFGTSKIAGPIRSGLLRTLVLSKKISGLGITIFEFLVWILGLGLKMFGFGFGYIYPTQYPIFLGYKCLLYTYRNIINKMTLEIYVT